MKDLPIEILKNIISEYDKSLKEIAQKYDLKTTELFVLKVIYSEEDCDTITKISSKYHILKSLTCMCTQTLQLHGLLKLSEINFDKKTIHFRATSKADRICLEALTAEEDFVNRCLADFSNEEKEVIKNMLFRIINNITTSKAGAGEHVKAN